MGKLSCGDRATLTGYCFTEPLQMSRRIKGRKESEERENAWNRSPLEKKIPNRYSETLGAIQSRTPLGNEQWVALGIHFRPKLPRFHCSSIWNGSNAGRPKQQVGDNYTNLHIVSSPPASRLPFVRYVLPLTLFCLSDFKIYVDCYCSYELNLKVWFFS